MIRGRIFRSVPDTNDEPGTKTKDFNNESQYPSHLYLWKFRWADEDSTNLLGQGVQKLEK